jgi:hypothetical protein
MSMAKAMMLSLIAEETEKWGQGDPGLIRASGSNIP